MSRLVRWVCPRCGAAVQVIGSASVGHYCERNRTARGAKVFTLFEREKAK